MIIRTEIEGDPCLLEVNLDDSDGEPFLDGIWDMDGNEIDEDDLPERDAERILQDAIREVIERRNQDLVDRMEDWSR